MTFPVDEAIVLSGQIPFEIPLIELGGGSQSFKIIYTVGRPRPFPCLLQGREQHGGKNGDYDYPAGAEFLTFVYFFFLIIKHL